MVDDRKAPARPGDVIGLALVVYAVLCTGYLDPIPSTNQEVYFAWARQYVDPDWMPGSFTFEEWPGTRVLFQWIDGPPVGVAGFERVAFFGTLLNLAALSLPMAMLLRRFRLGAADAIVLLLAFRELGQCYLSHEWIFGPFEPKTIAYVFALSGVVALLRSRPGWATAFAAVATWLHVLVGGWTFVAMSLFWLAGRDGLAAVFRRGLAFTLAVAPLLAYLVAFQADSTPVRDGVHASWIYVYWRNAHHTAPFIDGAVNWDFLPGVIGCAVALVLCALAVRRLTDPAIRSLNRLNGVFLAMLFAALVAGWFDREGEILKYYPFRVASLALLTSGVEALAWLRHHARPSATLERHARVPLALACLWLVWVGVGRIDKFSESPGIDRARETAAFAREHTERDAVFLFLDDPELRFDKFELVSFMRRAERERFVVRKFIPAGDKVYEWYHRMLERERVERDLGHLATLRRDYRIDYVVSRVPRISPELREVFRSDDGVTVYRTLP